jgi:cytochrome c-type biogenesis protein
MLGAALFVLGFSGVFVSGGVIFGQFGSNLRLHEVAVNRIFGIITIIFGLAFLGRLPLLQREWRLPKIPSSGLLGAPLLGVAFGFSWTPCLTPTFGTVYFLSLSSGAAGRGAFLSACYCFGLGIPFLVFAGAFGWVNSSVGFFRRHGRLVTLVGGGSLLIMGILLLTNQWQYWVDALRDQVGAGGFEF